MSEKIRPPLAADTLALLKQDQPHSTISQEDRGERQFRYLKASTAITIANEIFGIGGWSTSVISIDAVRNDQDRIIGYSAIVRVTIHENGAQYEDVGTNSLDGTQDGYDRNPNTMTAHDIARKGAVSDGMKRCLRHLGQMLGNNLYEDYSDRADVANAALDRLEPILGTEKAEEAVYGTKYQHTSEIPLHHSLAILLAEPDHSEETSVNPADPVPAQPPEEGNVPATPGT